MSGGFASLPSVDSVGVSKRLAGSSAGSKRGSVDKMRGGSAEGGSPDCGGDSEPSSGGGSDGGGPGGGVDCSGSCSWKSGDRSTDSSGGRSGGRSGGTSSGASSCCTPCASEVLCRAVSDGNRAFRFGLSKVPCRSRGDSPAGSSSSSVTEPTEGIVPDFGTASRYKLLLLKAKGGVVADFGLYMVSEADIMLLSDWNVGLDGFSCEGLSSTSPLSSGGGGKLGGKGGGVSSSAISNQMTSCGRNGASCKCAENNTPVLYSV